MFAFTLLCISFLLSFVHASPLSLRTVFSPHITSPNKDSVWPVGTKQFVTWETSDIPPDSELTDVNGKVVLGHLGSDGSLNLDIDNPLAKNFKLRGGKIQITVPNVPPREDYIVVLFGDSGNNSPTFAITKITGNNSGASSAGGGKATSVTQLTSLITTPIPITGPGLSLPSTTGTATTTDVPSGSVTTSLTTSAPTATSPATSGTSSGSSSGTSSAAAPTNTNAASSLLQFTGTKMTLGLASFILVLLI